MGNEAFTEAQEKQIVEVIRAMFRRMGEELERKTNDTEQRVIVTVRRVRQI